jgi:hypothetical protein
LRENHPIKVLLLSNTADPNPSTTLKMNIINATGNANNGKNSANSGACSGSAVYVEGEVVDERTSFCMMMYRRYSLAIKGDN